MKRYIALLRGVNISGKNKISMAELKTGLTELGFATVRTYLNSGNIIFSTDEGNELILAGRIKTMMNSKHSEKISRNVIIYSKE